MKKRNLQAVDILNSKSSVLSYQFYLHAVGLHSERIFALRFFNSLGLTFSTSFGLTFSTTLGLTFLETVVIEHALAVDGILETSATLAAHFHVDARTIRRDMSALQTKGVIRRDGPDKGGRWIIVIATIS